MTTKIARTSVQSWRISNVSTKSKAQTGCCRSSCLDSCSRLPPAVLGVESWRPIPAGVDVSWSILAEVPCRCCSAVVAGSAKRPILVGATADRDCFGRTTDNLGLVASRLVLVRLFGAGSKAGLIHACGSSWLLALCKECRFFGF